MKKFGLLFSFLLLTTQLAWGQTTINFDTAANWIQDGAIAFTSYGNHAYAESGVTIQGTNVVRNTTTAQDGFPGALGTYSMRIGNTTSSKATITVSTGGVSSFSIKVRRWDASPMPNYTVKTSVDGGSNWSSLTNIDGTLLTTSDWFTYSGSVNDASDNIIIEIANNTVTATERIMIDDFTWTGSTGSTPTKLAVTSINSGSSPSVNTSFNVVVQAQDVSNNPAAVSENTGITLSLASGNGSLGGTLTGTILSGETSVTFSGITYDVVESGVSITATRTSGDALTAGTSATFTVLSAANHLAFVNVPAVGQQNVNLSSFTVEARRGDNSVDLNYTGSITIDKASGSGAISGTLTKSAISGVATFNDIQFDEAGAYTISATASGLTGATSGTINILSTALPLAEYFDYTQGTTLVNNGWLAHSGSGTNSITVGETALTYTAYPLSGTGRSVSLVSTGEDVNRVFADVTTGSVYASFLVNVTSTQTTGDYFFHLGPAGILSAFYGKVFAKKDASTTNFALGVAKNVNASVVYTNFDYVPGTTYLIVVKYTFNTGTTTDDEVKLWVNPALTENRADINFDTN